MLGKVISFYISLIQQTSQNIKVTICIKSMCYGTLLLFTAGLLATEDITSGWSYRHTAKM